MDRGEKNRRRHRWIKEKSKNDLQEKDRVLNKIIEVEEVGWREQRR